MPFQREFAVFLGDIIQSDHKQGFHNVIDAKYYKKESGDIKFFLQPSPTVYIAKWHNLYKQVHHWLKENL